MLSLAVPLVTRESEVVREICSTRLDWTRVNRANSTSSWVIITMVYLETAQDDLESLVTGPPAWTGRKMPGMQGNYFRYGTAENDRFPTSIPASN